MWPVGSNEFWYCVIPAGLLVAVVGLVTAIIGVFKYRPGF